MSTPRLFEPIDVGALHVANRIVIVRTGRVGFVNPALLPA